MVAASSCDITDHRATSPEQYPPARTPRRGRFQPRAASAWRRLAPRATTRCRQQGSARRDELAEVTLGRATEVIRAIAGVDVAQRLARTRRTDTELDEPGNGVRERLPALGGVPSKRLDSVWKVHCSASHGYVLIVFRSLEIKFARKPCDRWECCAPLQGTRAPGASNHRRAARPSAARSPRPGREPSPAACRGRSAPGALRTPPRPPGSLRPSRRAPGRSARNRLAR